MGLTAVWMVVPAALAGVARAQTYSFDFESPLYNGSATGTLLSAGFGTPPILGQDGWYMPLSTSGEYSVYTYAGNTFAFTANPAGGTQFGGARCPPAGHARHHVCFGTGGRWRLTYDVAVRYTGTPPAVDPLGHVGLYPSSSRRFRTALSWGNMSIGPAPLPAYYGWTVDRFHHAIAVYLNAAPNVELFYTPSEAFRDLLVNNWYRVSIDWDFDGARFLACSIQDLTGGGGVISVDVSANNWFLFGGPNSTNPLPTDLGLTVAGSPGDLAAFDNILVEPIGPQCYSDCNGDGGLTVADFGCFQTSFVGNGTYADCNCDGQLTVSDFGCFQTAFVAGCP